jgi:hypothetical protein
MPGRSTRSRGAGVESLEENTENCFKETQEFSFTVAERCTCRGLLAQHPPLCLAERRHDRISQLDRVARGRKLKQIEALPAE